MEGTRKYRQLPWSSLLYPTSIKSTCLWVLPSEMCSKLPSTLVYIPYTPVHSLTTIRVTHPSTPTSCLGNTDIHSSTEHILRTLCSLMLSVCPSRAYAHSSLILCSKTPLSAPCVPSGSLTGPPPRSCLYLKLTHLPPPPFLPHLDDNLTSCLLPSCLSPSNPISFPESFPRKLEIMDLSPSQPLFIDPPLMKVNYNNDLINRIPLFLYCFPY